MEIKDPKEDLSSQKWFICPICARVHTGDASFCPNTGEPIQPGKAVVSWQEAPTQKSMPVQRPAAKRAMPRSKIGLIIGLSVAGVLFILGLLVWPFGVIKPYRIVEVLRHETEYPTPTRKAERTGTPRPTTKPTPRSTATSSLPEGAGVEPGGDPAILSAAEMLTDIENGDVDYLEAYAEEDNGDAAYAGNRYEYTVTFSNEGRVLFAFGWCAATAEILDENFQNISLQFTINGNEVPFSQATEYQWDTTDGVCGLVGYELINWPYGEHHLEIAVTFEAVINDGWSDYPQGTFYHDYTVYIGN